MLFEADYAKNYASIMYQCLLSTILVTVPFITFFTVPFFKLLYDLFFVFSKYCCLVVVLPIFASFALYHNNNHVTRFHQ